MWLVSDEFVDVWIDSAAIEGLDMKRSSLIPSKGANVVLVPCLGRRSLLIPLNVGRLLCARMLLASWWSSRRTLLLVIILTCLCGVGGSFLLASGSFARALSGGLILGVMLWCVGRLGLPIRQHPRWHSSGHVVIRNVRLDDARDLIRSNPDCSAAISLSVAKKWWTFEN